MAVYIVTGKLGSGKTLCAVGRIREYLAEGRPVATNLDIDMVGLATKDESRVTVTRLPDHPKVVDLDGLGSGNSSYDELKNGLIVLDECGTWLNTREWQDKGRNDLIDWFLHSRKHGWDIMLIVQDLALIDKQIRTALCEFVVICRRLDRMSVPIISPFAKLFGLKVKMPKVHVATVKYGTSLDAPVSERWIYRGNDLYAAYDTKQIFKADNGIGLHTVLSRWHLKGRYMKPDYRKVLYALIAAVAVVGLYAVWRFAPHPPAPPVAAAKPKEVDAVQLAKTEAKPVPTMPGYFRVGNSAAIAVLKGPDGSFVVDRDNPVADRGLSSYVDIAGQRVQLGQAREAAKK